MKSFVMKYYRSFVGGLELIRRRGGEMDVIFWFGLFNSFYF